MYVPPGFGVVTPYVVVNNALDYLTFLVEALGAQEMDRTVDPSGRIAHASVRFGGDHPAAATIMLSEGSPDFPASPISLYYYVADADAAMARALEHGAHLISEAADRPYGDRQGGVRDPAGNIWWISQRLVEAPYH